METKELPKIYGFNNGGPRGFMHAVAIAADGTVLGGHICSNESFMPYDLGMIEGSRRDRHESQYQPHYPSGYQMEFVPSDKIDTHAGLQEAFRLNKLKVEADTSVPVDPTPAALSRAGGA